MREFWKVLRGLLYLLLLAAALGASWGLFWAMAQLVLRMLHD